jgi:very-short-patch-repair endonuclease
VPHASRAVSEDFFSGDVARGLSRMRLRLLDLTNGNRLLNFRHYRKSSLRIVDELPDPLFSQLVDGRELSFKAAGPDNGSGPSPVAFDLPLPPAEASSPADVAPRRHASRAIQTRHQPVELEDILRTIGSSARLAIEETGTNMLYLVFGFLEWYEADESAEAHHAPLLLLPVSLERSVPDENTRTYRYSIRYSGEDIVSNITLRERLKHDYNLQLPDLDDGETPEEYFLKVQPLVRHDERWRIRRQATLTLLSFGKLLLYKDLDPRSWPPHAGPADHPRVTEFFEGVQREGISHAPEYALDDPAIQPRVPMIIDDADSSQHSALIDALEGRSLVIEGPPGTGKSQTITNLIAAALARGKTVLFVSEKLAALEVVRHRLDKVGLGAFCLELHSHKTQKRKLLDDIEARIAMHGRFPPTERLEEKQRLLERERQRLDEYSTLINHSVGRSGRSLFNLIWSTARRRRSLPLDPAVVDTMRLPKVSELTPEDFEQRRELMARFATHLTDVMGEAGDVSAHPWNGVTNASLTFLDEPGLVERLEAFVASARELNDEMARLEVLVGGDWLPDSPRGLMETRAALETLPREPGDVIASVLPRLHDEHLRAQLREFIGAVRRYRELDAVVDPLGAEPTFGLERATLDRQYELEKLPPLAELRRLALVMATASWWSVFRSDYRDAKRTYQGIARDGRTVSRGQMATAFRELADFINAEHLAELDGLRGVIAGAHPVSEALGEHWAGPDTDIARVERTLALHQSIADASVPELLKQWLFDEVTRLADLPRWCASLEAKSATVATQWASFDAVAHVSVRDWLGDFADIGTCPVTVAMARGQRAIDGRSTLPGWLDYLRARADTEEVGLDALLQLARQRHLTPDALVPALEFVTDNSLVHQGLEDHPALLRFSGLSHDKIRERFARLDEETIELYRARAAFLIDQRPVPPGVGVGPVSSFTELHLLEREIAKQRRHVPIRQLMRRSGQALQALKPCFMMGPLSVAQYLQPGALTFDLVIMDEASQLKPEDALGAIARAAQVVIVGDAKQLPPTSFFDRIGDEGIDDAEDVEETVSDAESILDVASMLYRPSRLLRWHYRSRHGSLIAFSNREFYDSRLVIFPSPIARSPAHGVKLVPVDDGVYEYRRNQREAERVVDAALEHMHARRAESLGIVTLNATQRELIESLIDERLKSDPTAQQYVQARAEGLEPFFVKNLENVQGDERDVIFLSVTYGPSPQGQVYQRFGPINGATGHRRLNVLFTRARDRVVVFSSLRANQVSAPAGSSWGVRALKGYLGDAENAGTAHASLAGQVPATDFETEVAAALRERGFDAVARVGVAGYYVDLAVRHPHAPDTFVLGIECDGGSYHGGLSARDRDRLRPAVLERLGWAMHRIWSADWVKHRDHEVDRIVARIRTLAGEGGSRSLADTIPQSHGDIPRSLGSG